MKRILFVLFFMLIFVTPVHAIYTHTIDTSTVAFGTCGGTSCNNVTGANDTSWSSYAWQTCGGSPCGSTDFFENYTYNSLWNDSYSNNSNITIKFMYNSSYGNTFLKIYNYSSSAWDNCNWWSMNNGIYNFTCIITPAKRTTWMSGTNSIRINLKGTVNMNENGTWYESYLQWNTSVPYITNCSTGLGSAYITYVCKDESTLNNITCPLDSSVYTGGTNQSFQFRSSSSYQVCFEPNNTYYVTNATSKYWGTGYSTRYHFLENANVSSNQNITLLLLNSSDSTLITMLIKDQVENPVENEIILIQKQDLGAGTYTQVSMAKSDFSGYAYTYLKLHEIYKFFLIKNGIIQREFEPMQLESNSLTFYVSQIDTPEYFSYYNQVATSCTNVTNNLTCTWVDTSGLTADMNLYVGKIDQVGETTFCDVTDSGTSGTLLCDLSTGGNFRYVFKGTYHSNPITYVWQSGYIGGSTVVDFGVVGLILTFLIVSFVAFMTHNDVKLCLVSTAFALIFCSVISLVRFGTDAMAMTFTVGIVSGIVAFKIRY